MKGSILCWVCLLLYSTLHTSAKEAYKVSYGFKQLKNRPTSKYQAMWQCFCLLPSNGYASILLLFIAFHSLSQPWCLFNFIYQLLTTVINAVSVMMPIWSELYISMVFSLFFTKCHIFLQVSLFLQVIFMEERQMLSLAQPVFKINSKIFHYKVAQLVKELKYRFLSVMFCVKQSEKPVLTCCMIKWWFFF